MYDKWKTLEKGLITFALFLAPFLVDAFIVAYPDLAQLSIGAGLVMVLNWSKNRNN